jgi:hypothetical protein
MTLMTPMTQSSGGLLMPDNNQAPRPSLNPMALSVTDAALVLTRTSGQTVTESMIREDIAEGAPTNVNGTINLVHYAAWLVKEMADAD